MPASSHPATGRTAPRRCAPCAGKTYRYGTDRYRRRWIDTLLSPGAAIVLVPALSALLPNRILHFSGFFDRPDIPPFPTLSSAWIPPFPGAAIISAPASFRCRSYAGIFSFPESIAVRRLRVFSLPVFRFWISERAAFLPLGFCAVVFSGCIRRFCPVTAPFSDLGSSQFLSSFCPALDAFLSSRRWCLPY